MSPRAEFEAARGFPLDDFQAKALDALDAGRSVLVAAPTGSGKTLVAEYAIELALSLGEKVFYTTPLKALSNQKFGDFRRAYGEERVGLLTGDTSVNGDAAVVVMTTEVLRNMIYAGSSTLDGLRFVVLDEVHYLQDRYRGAVWEEVIVHLPLEVDLVCLSATVSNAEELAEWIATVRGATTAVIEERRPVVLHHRYLLGERGVDGLHLLPTFVGTPDDLKPNPEVAKLDRQAAHGPRDRGRTRSRLRPPGRVEMVELLARESLLPAIAFVFSRKGCEQAVEQCRASGLVLTTADEAKQIRAIADAHTAGLDDDDLAVLGFGAWRAGLEAGLASHHAGLVPPMKEAVEEAFAAGLVKVVFATETLALGINMPARSVVIEKLTKFTGERHEMLTPGEYTQLTGRAGRRGIDDVGYAVVCWSPWVTFEQVAGLASRRTDALRSSFRPTYNMTVNLVRRYSSERAHHLLNLSFAQFHTDRDVVALERQLERTQTELQRERESAPGARRNKRVDRLERDAARLERRVRSRSESLARQLDQVRSVLESWGYVDGWALSPAGEVLASLYTETDLLLAEAMREGLLDGIKVAELAALVSCFSYERRGSDSGEPAPPARWPTGRVAERYRAVEKLWRALSASESDAGLPETRAPDPGFTPYAYEWARGEDLGAILDDDELAGGDFVRNIRQCVDLLGQVAEVAPATATREAAHRAVDACMRGVIRAAAVVTS